MMPTINPSNEDTNHYLACRENSHKNLLADIFDLNEMALNDLKIDQGTEKGEFLEVPRSSYESLSNQSEFNSLEPSWNQGYLYRECVPALISSVHHGGFRGTADLGFHSSPEACMNQYMHVLSEERMPSKVRDSKLASLTRYTWCVFEMLKLDKHKSFKKDEIIDTIDSVGVCDQSTKDRPSMMKRLSRVLEVFISIRIVRSDSSKTNFRWVEKAHDQAPYERPMELIWMMEKKKRLAELSSTKQQELITLRKRLECLQRLIQRNKIEVKVTCFNVGPQNILAPVRIQNNNRISLTGSVVVIPFQHKDEVKISLENGILHAKSRFPVPRSILAWDILDKIKLSTWEFIKRPDTPTGLHAYQSKQ
jgi:hypothetical protein